MMKKFKFLAVLSAVLLTLNQGGSISWAQEDIAAELFVCMKPISPSASNIVSLIILPAEDQPRMVERGFVRVEDCGHDADALREFVAKACELAEKAPQDFLEKFAMDNNISAEEMCSLAKKVQLRVVN